MSSYSRDLFLFDHTVLSDSYCVLFTVLGVYYSKVCTIVNTTVEHSFFVGVSRLSGNPENQVGHKMFSFFILLYFCLRQK